MAALAYVGDPQTSKLKPAQKGVTALEAILAAVLGWTPILLLTWGQPGLLALPIAACAAAVPALLARRLIGGYTGDVLGAVEQLAEIGLLLGFAIKGVR